MDTIKSLQNPGIKNIIRLHKASERKKQGLFLIEGRREIFLALESGYKLESLYYCPAYAEKTDLEKIDKWSNVRNIETDEKVFEKIAYRETSGGLIAVARQAEHRLPGIRLNKTPLIVVIESVEKPGNLGAILRTADAAAITAVIICDPRTDFYNPNVVRSSLGCVFTVQTAKCSSNEAVAWLNENSIRVFASALTATGYYHEADFLGPSAIVLGSEDRGLTEGWLNGSAEQIKIPMSGKHDSLNVAASAAIIVFEAMRQRKCG